jgi:uncharacterized protein (TIGR03083 family)
LYKSLDVEEVVMMELISAGRLALADALGTLTDEQWRGASMCAGWTPAHVLAHLTMPFRIPGEEFMAGLQRHGGDFTAYSDEIAERDSALPPAELVAVLLDNAENPWSPPGGGLTGALSHDLIHGLDMTWPIPVHYPIAGKAMITVLDSVTSKGAETIFGISLAGVRVTAIDLGWSAGDGAPLHGASRDLLLLLAGRQVPAERFEGEGARLAGVADAR